MVRPGVAKNVAISAWQIRRQWAFCPFPFISAVLLIGYAGSSVLVFRFSFILCLALLKHLFGTYQHHVPNLHHTVQTDRVFVFVDQYHGVL